LVCFVYKDLEDKSHKACKQVGLTTIRVHMSR
jgi:hypothetical protein